MRKKPIAQATPPRLVVPKRRVRKAPARFFPNAAQVTLQDEAQAPHAGVVLDESQGGLGLLVQDAQGLAAEQEVEVRYHGASMRAIITNVQSIDRHICRIGLKWKPPRLEG